MNLTRKEITRKLEELIWIKTQQRGVFGCFEVTMGYRGRERVDYMTLDTKGIYRCYEIKSCLEDFNSLAKISFVGNYNYYVMTKELLEIVKEEIPNHIGVFIWDDRFNEVACVKNPKRQDLLIKEDVLKDSLLRSLARENQKVIDKKFCVPKVGKNRIRR